MTKIIGIARWSILVFLCVIAGHECVGESVFAATKKQLGAPCTNASECISGLCNAHKCIARPQKPLMKESPCLVCLDVPGLGYRCTTRKNFNIIMSIGPRDFVKSSKDWCRTISQVIQSALLIIGKEAVKKRQVPSVSIIQLIKRHVHAARDLGCNLGYPYQNKSGYRQVIKPAKYPTK